MATRLKNLRLSELSLVDRPANKRANVSIFKRAEPRDTYTVEKDFERLVVESHPYWKRDFTQEERDAAASSGAAMEDGSFPIKGEQDLKNAVHAIGRASDSAKAKAHIISRAKTLGCTDLLPDGWVSKNAPTNGDGQMDEKAIQKAISDGIATATADLKKQLDASTAQIATLMKMSDTHTNYMNHDKAVMPKGGKPAFSAMSPGERDAHMKANPLRAAAAEDAADGGADDASENADGTKKMDAKKLAAAVAKAVADEEVIKIGDREVRKSAVGADMFAIFKAQQAEIVKANDARELVELQKRADTEFLRLPETSVAKAKVLKAMAAMPEAERASLEKMLKAGNDAIGKGMKVIGADGGENTDDPIQKLDALAKTHAAANKIDFHKAYAQVIETDAGRELYAQMGRPKAAA